MGQMTKSTLLHLLEGEEDDHGFIAAQQAATEALAAFEEPVWRTIQSQTVWSGVGQPDAELVLHNNTLSLDISQVMMESAAATMTAAVHGFTTLSANLWRLNSYAKELGAWVTEGGTVGWDDKNPKRPADPIGPDDEFRRINTESAVQQTLKLATTLDKSTKASLDVVYRRAPEVTIAPSSDALARNRQTFVDALDDRQAILEVAATWYLLDDYSLLGVDDVRAAGGQPFPEGVTKHLEELDLILKGIGLTSAGPLVSLLQGDLAGALLGGVMAGAAVVGKRTTDIGVKIATRLITLPGKYLGVAGAAQFFAEVAVYAAGKLAPEGEPTSHPVVTHDGQVKAQVNDRELAGLGSAYYSPTGAGNDKGESVAELAHLQRVGALGEGSDDFVAQAKQTRADLQTWLAEHQDLSSDDPDRIYAEGLIKELDASIGYLT